MALFSDDLDSTFGASYFIDYGEDREIYFNFFVNFNTASIN